jgi:protein TonB
MDVTTSSYIPISFRKDITPPVREIPKPPARRTIPAARKIPPGMVPDKTAPSIAPVPEESPYIKPLEMAAPEMPAPETAQEPAAMKAEIPETAPASASDANAGAASSSPLPLSGEDSDKARMDYFNAVRLKIEQHKAYPEIARQQQIEGVTVAAFAIHPDGSISDLSVASGSGHESLDAAAMEAVTNAAPFSPLPEKYFNKPAMVKVPIAFQIIR